MPTLIGRAIDPTMPAPWPVSVETPALVAPVPITPEPEPGDPDTPFVPPVYAGGIEARVLLRNVVTHDVVDEVRTAVVEDFDDDVDLLVPTSAAIRASMWDPITEAVASESVMGPHGTDVHRWDPRLFETAIGINGSTRWVGVFRQPVEHGADEWLLPSRSPAIMFHDDTLGRIEQLDLYDGRGDFEQYAVGSTPPGIEVPSGCTAVVVADGVRGTRSLEVTGPTSQWVFLWKVPVPGAADHRRSVEGSVFARFPTEDVFGVGERCVITYAALDGVTVNADVSLAKNGVRPESGTGWTEDPISSGASLSASTRNHMVWIAVRCHPDGIRYDLARVQQGILTGFLNPTDGAEYPVRVLRDLQRASMGGFPYGLTSRIESLTGVEYAETWNHNGLHVAADVLSAVMDREGGPEAYINPQWVMVIRDRLGQVRTDIRLDPTNCLTWDWQIDPGAQADDFVGLTGRGSGTSLLTATVSQPRVANRHRSTKMVRIPNDLSLNSGVSWTRRHARVAARQQVVATAMVDWWLAEELARGDTLEVAFAHGAHGLFSGSGGELMRLVNKRWMPAQSTCLLSLGMVGADDA